MHEYTFTISPAVVAVGWTIAMIVNFLIIKYVGITMTVIHALSGKIPVFMLSLLIISLFSLGELIYFNPF